MTAVRLGVDDTAMAAAFSELSLERGLRHDRYENWSTAAEDLPTLGDVVASRSGPDRVQQVVVRDEGVLRITLSNGRLHLLAACGSREHAEALVAIVRHQVPPRPTTDPEQRVTVSFWAQAIPEPSRIDRRLDVPAWAAIDCNYAPATRSGLDELMTARPPLSGGRLVLWHGPPGTGKTNALRALAWEWREHAAVHYVTDPEELLTRPGYMQSLLLDRSDRRWRLIVLEDAADLVTPDAGAGLARLLNLTDGFVGQGLKVLVLITGNEPLERLHPAIARPGRCAAEVAFERFDAAGAAAWLADHGEEQPPGPATLAELYAALDGRTAPERKRPVGFLAA